MQYLIAQAAQAGNHLTAEDYAHEDIDEHMQEDYMTDEQIARLEEYENKIRERAAATRPPTPEPPDPQPSQQHEDLQDAVPNIVRYDNIIGGGISDELKAQLVAYAPIERLIALVSSWRIQQREFASHEAFTAQIVRFGCTCIMHPTNKEGGVCEYTLDAYYEKKKEDAEKNRRRQREVRTATSVARMAARMSGIARTTNTRIPMNLATDEEVDDEEDARKRALRIAQGGDGSLFTPSSIEFVELDEIPAFADDHAQMRVTLRKLPGHGRNTLVVESLSFVVREVEY